jgi:branched-chain amino acid transport system substrate-binding protein
LIVPALATAQSNEEYRVGLMTELTGPWVTGSGALCKRGYELARKTLVKDGTFAGRKIKFLYGDTQGTGKDAISEFQRLVSSEGAQVIVTNRSQVGMALNPLSLRSKIPLIGIVGHNDFVADNPYSFRTWPSTELEAQTLSNAALTRGSKKLAVVALEDEWTISFRDEFVSHYTENGGTIVVSESFLQDDVDFSSFISRLKQMDIDSILVDLGPTQTGTFLAKLREQKVQARLYGNFYVRNQEVLKEAGAEALEGIILTEIDVNKPKLRDGLMKNFNDDEPNQYKYTCFAGVALALAAIEDAKNNSKEEIYSALSQTQSLELFGDRVPIVDRELIPSMVLRTYAGGVLIEIPAGK